MGVKSNVGHQYHHCHIYFNIKSKFNMYGLWESKVNMMGLVTATFIYKGGCGLENSQNCFLSLTFNLKSPQSNAAIDSL